MKDLDKHIEAENNNAIRLEAEYECLLGATLI